MIDLDLNFPDLSGHPPPPRMSFEEYERWIFDEIVPMLVEQGEMTHEKLIADFQRNEGSVTAWPDFTDHPLDPPSASPAPPPGTVIAP